MEISYVVGNGLQRRGSCLNVVGATVQQTPSKLAVVIEIIACLYNAHSLSEATPSVLIEPKS